MRNLIDGSLFASRAVVNLPAQCLRRIFLESSSATFSLEPSRVLCRRCQKCLQSVISSLRSKTYHFWNVLRLSSVALRCATQMEVRTSTAALSSGRAKPMHTEHGATIVITLWRQFFPVRLQQLGLASCFPPPLTSLACFVSTHLASARSSTTASYETKGTMNKHYKSLLSTAAWALWEKYAWRVIVWRERRCTCVDDRTHSYRSWGLNRTKYDANLQLVGSWRQEKRSDWNTRKSFTCLHLRCASRYSKCRRHRGAMFCLMQGAALCAWLADAEKTEQRKCRRFVLRSHPRTRNCVAIAHLHAM